MKRFAIGDIHGCFKTFSRLVERLNIGKNDKLYLLGDYINKGPSSRQVLELIMDMKNSGYQVYAVRGNHDQRLIDVRKGNVEGSWSKDRNLINTLKSFGVSSPFDVAEDYLRFLDSLPYYVEEEDAFFVHAGFNFNVQNLFLDKGTMLNIKKMEPDFQRLKGKRLIHGHIPIRCEQVLERIFAGSQVLNLDSGCVYYKTEEMGILTALDLDQNSLIFQNNIDGPYDGGQYH